MGDTRKAPGRRNFLLGLLTGAGAVAAFTAAPRSDAARTEPAGPSAPPGMILYRRTEETERYYRTLYR
jgi:hypothetical protein